MSQTFASPAAADTADALGADVIDRAAALAPGTALHALRHQRDKVVQATQGSDALLFDAALAGPPLAERLLVALHIARQAGSAALVEHYASRLRGLAHLSGSESAALRGAPLPEVAAADARLGTVLAFADTLADRPVEGDQAALLKLPAAGLSTPDVVALAQLIAFASYQVRVVAGLKALAALPALPPENATAPLAAGDTGEAPFVHPAHLPPAGEPVRVNGYTSATLSWKGWLPVLDVNAATPEQLAVLQESHPKAMTSDYYLTLIHQPRILQQRSVAFNAIMYAPGGLSRAERELASAVVSRVNGCVYCASVHAQRFEQLAKRNDVIYQVFTDPQGAGTTPRERAIVQVAIDLTRDPARFSGEQLQAAVAAGLSRLEVLDLVHAIAIFAWANRLMLNLGEAVVPA